MSKLCIYVTHGSLVSLKLLAHNYQLKNPDEQQVIATYQCTDKKYNIQSPSTNEQSVFCLEDFIEHIKKPVFRLCCDANLGMPNADQITLMMTSLVNALQPEELLLFSENHNCMDDALTNYIPSLADSFVQRATAVERSQLKAIVDHGIPDIISLTEVSSTHPTQ